jgi:hypothetical protein
MSPKPTLQIILTPQQQEQLQKATGKPITSLKLQALEERVSPSLCNN